MIITKYEHACLTIEVNDRLLVIDPGEYSRSLPVLTGVEAIVITHIHGDHLDKTRLRQIIENSPEAKLFANAQVMAELADLDDQKVLVQTGDNQKTANFELSFSGADHAVVFATVPCTNLGVTVNQTLYYPGDSLDLPPQPIKVLALPISGPWLKLGEALQCLIDTKPKCVFLTHDSHLSAVGLSSAERWVGMQLEASGSGYQALGVGESFEI